MQIQISKSMYLSLHQKYSEPCVPKYFFDRCWHQGATVQTFWIRWKPLAERLQISLVQIMLFIHQVAGEVLSKLFSFRLLKKKKEIVQQLVIKHLIEACFLMDLLWISAEAALFGAVVGKDRELVQFPMDSDSASMRQLAWFCFLLTSRFHYYAYFIVAYNECCWCKSDPNWSLLLEFIYWQLWKCILERLFHVFCHVGVHNMLCISVVHQYRNFSISLQTRNGSNSFSSPTASSLHRSLLLLLFPITGWSSYHLLIFCTPN